jgi:hypothetical protein
MKYLRLGLTECSLLLFYFLINIKNDKSITYDKGLINWLYSTSGFYDKSIKGYYFDFDNEYYNIINSVIFNNYFTELLKYLYECDYFSICLHQINIKDRKNELFIDYLKIKNIIPEDHKLLNTFLNNKRVLIVSSFGKLIEQQINSGNCKKINPNFPNISYTCYYITPHTFLNNINSNNDENNILITAEKIKNDINELLKIHNFDVAIISCGAYSCLIGGYINDILKKDSYVIGGALCQLFGICSKRFPYNDNLPNKEYWIKEIPEEYKPKDYLKIEGGCYW